LGHPIRFGVITVQNASWKALVKRWRFIEQVGFDTLWVADHFTVPVPSYVNMPWFEAWTTLSSLATQTSRIRIGTLVTPITWRNPAWLTRQALTVDHISHGRLELGLGTGDHGDPGHSMTGIEDWTPRERVERFGEYVEIVDLLLRNPVTTYHGKYYRLEAAHMQPPPVQKPRPPITIGAFSPLMLKYVARYADTWNRIGGILESDVEEVRRQNRLLDKYCDEIGRDPQSLRRSYLMCEFEAIGSLGPMRIYKSTDAFLEAVERCIKVGITEFVIGYPFTEGQIPVFEQIAKEIIPELRRLYN
jgi:alkanesulfonate monooxygenase SsuD/methylene tetrahydromethanopterin reductase-like flavin-dependent oxidoreductase (luciferase family)